MKLYEVEITIRAVVQAESLEDAYDVAHSERRDIVSDYDMDCIDVNGELLEGQRLPAGWNEQCYPYGQGYGIPEKTIAQIWADEAGPPADAVWEEQE